MSDIFSFTKAGERWFAWEWLSDVLMALAHELGGLGGIVLLSLLILGATSLCVYKSTMEESGQRVIAIVLTGLATAASTVHWLARPHLVTPLFGVLFCLVLNGTERGQSSGVLSLLPLLTVLWVNLHGGFFVGIVLLLTYSIGAAAEELVHGARQNAWIRARKYLFTAGACAITSLLNPYGYRLHVHVAEYVGASFYLQRISEFQSIDFHSFTAAYFETLLLLAIAAAMWHMSEGRLVDVLLLLSWSHLALFSARNIPIFAAISAPGIGLAIREWLERFGVRSALHSVRGLSASLVEIEAGLRTIANQDKRKRWHLLPCVAVVGVAGLLAHPGRVKPFMAEFDPKRFPTDAAAFLSRRESGTPVRLYASWQWGGYLIYRLWPSFTVFDDGRTDFYGPAFVEEGLRAWEARPGWADIFVRYRVNAALLPVDSPLTTVLRLKNDWKPVYEDSIAVIFRKIENERRDLSLSEVPMSETKETGAIEPGHARVRESSAGMGTNGSGTPAENRPAVRRRLPDERRSLTHHFSVGGQEGYVTVGLYEDGLPGEMFIRMAKEGSTVSGLMDSFATAVSLALQYGVPLQVLCDKFSHTRFEPSGWSGNPKIGYAKSLMDYLFRWLDLRFLKGEQAMLFERQGQAGAPSETGSVVQALGQVVGLGDAPACIFCGSLMVRNGSCYRCMECGSTSGCS